MCESFSNKKTLLYISFIYLTSRAVFFSLCFYDTILSRFNLYLRIIYGIFWKGRERRRNNILSVSPFYDLPASFAEHAYNFRIYIFFHNNYISFFSSNEHNTNQYYVRCCVGQTDITCFKEISDFPFVCFPIVSFRNYDLIDRLNCVCI